MKKQQLISQKAVLEAALHNIKTAENQLKSLYNPQDKSFPDLKINVSMLADEIKLVESEIRRLHGQIEKAED